MRIFFLGVNAPSRDDSRRASGTRTEFAVLVPLLFYGGRETILLTKRLDTLPQYPGQVCFPGGACDPGDRDLFETALRETEEEVGIARERITLLEELAWQMTGLGHRVKPFLARVEPGPVSPNPAEVDRVLYLPVERLTADLFRERGIWRDPNGGEHRVHTFDLDGFEVWGLTARILRERFGGGGPP